MVVKLSRDGEIDVFDFTRNKWGSIAEPIPTKRAGKILFAVPLMEVV